VVSPTQTLQLNNIQNSQQTDIHALAEFKPAVLASEGPHTHALDRAATGIGSVQNYEKKTLALKF